MQQYTIFEVLENGNLKITLTAEGKEYIKEKDGESYDLIWELFEVPMCNGYNWVKPEDIGALTDSILISDTIIDEETTDEAFEAALVWYNPNYMITNEIAELYEKGFIIFQKA